MVKSLVWFGKGRDTLLYRETEQVPTPVGELCVGCEEPVAVEDDGFFDSVGQVLHRECMLRGILGSAAHQAKRCSCFVEDGEEEGTAAERLGRRREAILAVAYAEGDELVKSVILREMMGKVWTPFESLELRD